MIRFNVGIGNILPLSLCTPACTTILRSLGIGEFSIDFDTNGNIILVIGCRSENVINLLHDNLVPLTLPKTDYSRRFVWVKCKNGLVKYVFNTGTYIIGETILNIIIHPCHCIIYCNPYIYELDIIVIMIDCFKQIMPGDVTTSTRDGEYLMRWHKTIKVMPEVAELMAQLMSEKIIGQINIL